MLAIIIKNLFRNRRKGWKIKGCGSDLFVDIIAYKNERKAVMHDKGMGMAGWNGWVHVYL